MEKWFNKPLSFSEILDTVFKIIKENFGKLFLLMLIITGPLYLIQGIALYLGGVPFLGAPVEGTGFEGYLNRLEQGGMEWDIPNAGLTETILMIVFSMLLYILAVPIAEAAILFAVNQIRRGEEIRLPNMFKKAFSRYFPLLGSTILYTLIMFGLFIGMGLIYALVIGVSTFATESAAFIIIFSILFFIGIGLGVSYLLIRWSFYFAAITFEKVSPGLSKSWNLTRGRYWRLLGIYFVLYIISSILSSVITMGLELLLGAGIITTAIQDLVAMLTMLILTVGYAVVYFDLLVRNEATDLQEIVESYEVQSTTNQLDQESMDQPVLRDEQELQEVKPSTEEDKEDK